MKSLFSMAASLSFLVLSALMAASAQQQRYSNISLGSSLTTATSSSWLSPSGLYAFGFYKLTNGYAVGVFIAGIPEKTVVWTANRDDPVFPSNAILLLTNDGRLILQQEDRDDINIASSVRPVVSASMLDNGNFVLYDSSRRITWQSFDSPTDTLLPGQRLQAGMELISSASKTNPARGIFRLAMQSDGNLVQYPVEISGPNYAYYSSGTMGTGMSDHLRFIVSYGGQFVNLNDEWKWIRDKTTSILVSTSITLTELEVRLKDKLGILDPRTQIELKFKISNMNIAPAQIRKDEDVKWYISVHNETLICVNVLEAELPSVGMGRDTNCPNCSFVIVGAHQNVQQEDRNHRQSALNNNVEAEREDVSMRMDTNC